MSSLSELIERVEKASGEDRELDEAIRVALNYPPKPWNYTASIDAALTLLPDGYAVERISIWKGCPASCVVLGTHLHNGDYWHQGKDGRWGAESSTPALALTAACLKARSAISKATGEA